MPRMIARAMLAPQLLHTQGSSGPCRGEDGATKRRLLVRRLLSVLALTLVVTGLAAIGLNNEVFAGFQRRATDSLFPAAPDSGDVVVVGFDRKVISDPALGNPLPREQVAALISKLNELGAKVIAFDVVYASERPDQVAGDQAMGSAIDSGTADVVLATKPVSRTERRRRRPERAVDRIRRRAGVDVVLVRAGQRSIQRRPDRRRQPDRADGDRAVRRQAVRPRVVPGGGHEVPRRWRSGHRSAPRRADRRSLRTDRSTSSRSP